MNEWFSVINRGNGWEEYFTEFASRSFFETLDEYRALVAQNPGTFYLLSVEQAGRRVRTIYSSEFGEGVIR